jgi:hypothetical protein
MINLIFINTLAKQGHAHNTKQRREIAGKLLLT